MATITITTPDENDEVLFESFATAFSYAPYVQDPQTGVIQPNPMSKQDFLAQWIKGNLIQVSAEYLLKSQTEAFLAQKKQEVAASVQDSIQVVVENK